MWIIQRDGISSKINKLKHIYNISLIQRRKGFELSYEVQPPYPYEVKAWDGYMDEGFLQELAS